MLTLADVLNNHRGPRETMGAILIGADKPFVVASRSFAVMPSRNTIGQTVSPVSDFLDNVGSVPTLSTSSPPSRYALPSRSKPPKKRDSRSRTLAPSARSWMHIAPTCSRKRYGKAASRINYIERKIGRDRDANTIDRSDLRNLLASVAHLSKQTRRHYGSTFLAMMNNAKADGIIRSHALGDARLPTVPKKTTRPVTWTPEELAVITGPALDQYEAEQAAWNRKVGNVAGTRSKRAPSFLPLRGLVLVAYFTLMRPKNNRALTWQEVALDPVKMTGSFELDQHKNVNKGIRAYGVLAPRLVKYLLSIRPPNARGYIHANPATGKPYVDIRKQWDRLIAIASDMLGYPLVNEKVRSPPPAARGLIRSR